MLAPYRKLVAALLGISALLALRYFDVTVAGLDSVVLELVVSALTAFGVYQVKNEA